MAPSFAWAPCLFHCCCVLHIIVNRIMRTFVASSFLIIVVFREQQIERGNKTGDGFVL